MWQKRSKFGNKSEVVDGHKFPSKKEAGRYRELKLLQANGYIKDLRLQVPYVLIPAQRNPFGKVIEAQCRYIADFVYYDNEIHNTIVEDVKGIRTKEYIIKRKLMLYVHGIQIKEI